MSFTAVFQKIPKGYIGFVEELPGANTQGDTIEETRENLNEAVQLVLEANRQLTEEEIAGQDVIREGRKHTVFVNRIKRKSSTVPRHNEINDFLAKKICKDLEISFP